MIKSAVSISFVTLMCVVFFVAAGSSRRELPVGLVDVYGDTSMIRALTIEGSVTGWRGQYGYTFHIEADSSRTEMYIFNDNRGYTRFVGHPSWMIPWHPSLFETVYVPVGEYEIVRVDDGWQTWSGSEIVYNPAYRIYGEVFAVEARFHGNQVVTQEGAGPGWGSSSADFERGVPHRLFVDVGPGGYLFATTEGTPLSQFQNNFYEVGRQRDANRHLAPLLTNAIKRESMQIFVQTGSRLFGETAVYGVPVYTDGGDVMRLGWIGTLSHDENARFIMAVELLPITLAPGDEILGLISITDGFLLLIMRSDALEVRRASEVTRTLEVTRYNFITGESYTVRQPEIIRLWEIYADGDGIIFRGERLDTYEWRLLERGTILRLERMPEEVVWTLDLGGGGLVLTEPAQFVLGGGEEEDAFIQVHTSLVRDGVVFFAYTMEERPWQQVNANTATFVSAFDTDGQLLGRVQVLNGVEDDRFWVFDSGGGMSQPFARRVRTVTLQ